ncbi:MULTISPECIES: type II toxin-antitoxin system HicA family toxin [unclassified Cryobacterium]|uniref:type II toxin-antitoxin system HicA family toxin n=1 Tax=unclassified Cryobacterium TaxID=2649013 RepID=UPI002AB5D317|nr:MULTISPECIES: type II toxin-antitoxin system HicA family toxin [unclassified Cryobacterium]MDY7528383.1 type II toxin-antitoxin system HicA family toxin [Cryobacterium sp. 10C2]MEB0202759.1 type II toxin-antitoxin system HicA family toxin [Cryobacterium sp. 5I3]MEB0288254.1 type II toxin-antitoxin system HicA family toxin [Cryobacterium sp. 10S3]MEB0291332.1 type II toxin-antitoxin system HicA family toxin [Cryobacterium sp. 10C2]WPX12128.1 type II toxin-antitoxin system HicA family toxin [
MTKPQKYRDVTKFLRSQGWFLLRPGKGGHQIWVSEDETQTITIPGHKELSAGVVRQITDAFPNTPQSWK